MEPQEETQNADFLRWYMNMIENYPSTFVHYLSEKAVFHWFGRTVQSPDKILCFIIHNLHGTKHIMRVPTTTLSTEHLQNNAVDVMAGGDGPNVTNALPKFCTEIGQGDYTRPRYKLETNGDIEFTKRYDKVGLSKATWTRPCTLRIGYRGCLSNPAELIIEWVIYGDNLTCRRNLLPEFEECIQNDSSD